MELLLSPARAGGKQAKLAKLADRTLDSWKQECKDYWSSLVEAARLCGPDLDESEVDSEEEAAQYVLQTLQERATFWRSTAQLLFQVLTALASTKEKDQPKWNSELPTQLSKLLKTDVMTRTIRDPAAVVSNQDIENALTLYCARCLRTNHITKGCSAVVSDSGEPIDKRKAAQAAASARNLGPQRDTRREDRRDDRHGDRRPYGSRFRSR